MTSEELWPEGLWPTSEPGLKPGLTLLVLLVCVVLAGWASSVFSEIQPTINDSGNYNRELAQ